MIRMIEKRPDDIYLVDLTEARRNPDLNPKISAYEALKPYSQDEDMYISFTSLDKMGLNPRSKYNTPLGIYTYPLAVIWKKYRVDQQKSVGRAVPFVGDQPYVWLLKVRKDGKFVDDMYRDYGSNDYDRDMQLVRKDMRDLGMSDEVIERFIDKHTKQAKDPSPITSMWNVTRNLADNMKGKAMVQWNVILREILGYSGFADKSGRGIIHPAEPFQAVFLHTRAFDVVGEFLNKDYAGIDIYDRVWDEEGKAWKGGTWEDGLWKNGLWEDGLWKNGEWRKGVWVKGTWNNGVWNNGDWYSGTWKNGVWEDGLWKNGEWKGGIWRKGKWHGGNWHGGNWHSGTWENGIWKKGNWGDGTWKNGIWQDGDWHGGTWLSGTWKFGEWHEGTWKMGSIYDPDKRGNFDPIWKWDNKGYVMSPISPKEYFGY